MHRFDFSGRVVLISGKRIHTAVKPKQWTFSKVLKSSLYGMKCIFSNSESLKSQSFLCLCLCAVLTYLPIRFTTKRLDRLLGERFVRDDSRNTIQFAQLHCELDAPRASGLDFNIVWMQISDRNFCTRVVTRIFHQSWPSLETFGQTYLVVAFLFQFERFFFSSVLWDAAGVHVYLAFGKLADEMYIWPRQVGKHHTLLWP